MVLVIYTLLSACFIGAYNTRHSHNLHKNVRVCCLTLHRSTPTIDSLFVPTIYSTTRVYEFIAKKVQGHFDLFSLHICSHMLQTLCHHHNGHILVFVVITPYTSDILASQQGIYKYDMKGCLEPCIITKNIIQYRNYVCNTFHNRWLSSYHM